MKTTRYRETLDTRASEWIGDMTVWLRQNAPDNSEQHERVLRNLPKVMKEELTPRQRQMVDMYFCQRKTIPAIAKELEINRSTVSRTLHRGMDNIRRCLKYSL